MNDEDDSKPGTPSKTNFVRDNIVYIHGDFDDTITTDVLHPLRKLIASVEKLKDPKIIVDIASNGGYVYVLAELIAILEGAKKKGIIVETRAMSHAHSCGAVLLMSGTKGHRHVSPLTYVLVHHASGGSYHSTDKQLVREFERAEHLNAMLRKLIEKYSKVPKKELDEMLIDDSYYVFGEKLVKFGIADTISYEV